MSLYILFDVKKKSTLNKLNADFCIISGKMYGMGRMWTLMLVKADKTTFKAYKTKVKNCNKYQDCIKDMNKIQYYMKLLVDFLFNTCIAYTKVIMCIINYFKILNDHLINERR